ncbi:MAG: bifunctional DNA-formamidopyrimidine glycosylase/DNA-(apurinic or apyrimidinic site) lyase [Pyrinomonadaceae bacterium]
MPELPEVELVCRALAAHCRGSRIASAQLIRRKLAPDITPKAFAEKLKGATIQQVSRYGKHIIFEFDKPHTLLAHLRMTGRFLLLSSGQALPKHTHALFEFEDTRRLAFMDQRHFGMMKVVDAHKLRQTKELKSLAPDPFSEDFTLDYLAAAFARSNSPIKAVLLNQTKVSGLGNIYAAEALFLAGIHPATIASTVSRARLKRLRDSILSVLHESILHGSTLNVDPQNLEGSYYGGGFGGMWRVYDRENAPCSQCARKVKRIIQAGRSTYFCGTCQRS